MDSVGGVIKKSKQVNKIQQINCLSDKIPNFLSTWNVKDPYENGGTFIPKSFHKNAIILFTWQASKGQNFQPLWFMRLSSSIKIGGRKTNSVCMRCDIFLHRKMFLVNSY